MHDGKCNSTVEDSAGLSLQARAGLVAVLERWLLRMLLLSPAMKPYLSQEVLEYVSYILVTFFEAYLNTRFILNRLA